jgi:hypothetical protein
MEDEARTLLDDVKRRNADIQWLTANDLEAHALVAVAQQSRRRGGRQPREKGRSKRRRVMEPCRCREGWVCEKHPERPVAA